MTSLRVFTCGPYGATLRPEACAQRFAPSRGRQSPGAGARVDRIHCHECPVGAAHARGEDAPGVEYSLVDVSAPRPVPRPPSHRESFSMPATTTETRPTRPCAHPNCGVPFVPTHHRSLYCVDHRTPAAALERKTLRDELDAALERAAEATRAKTEPPTPHAPVEPESDEAVRQRSTDAATAWATRRRERAAAGWVPDCELDHIELAKASADEVLEEDRERGEKWVPWRWLLDHRSKMLRGFRNVVATTKEAVGEAWTKDRPLAEAVTAKCAFLEADAQREHDAGTKRVDELQRELADLRTTLVERGERIEVLQREIAAAEGPSDLRRRADELQRERDEMIVELRETRDELRTQTTQRAAAFEALIDIEVACHGDLDRHEVAELWRSFFDERFAAEEAAAVAAHVREIVEFVDGLRREREENARRVMGREKTKRAAGLVEAIVEATTPPVPRPVPLPPGVGAAALLRAVGYQVATVESPRGPVIVVEGARG